MNKILGIVLIVMALTLAIAPAFTDCHSQGRMLTTKDGKQVDMKCHWTGIAEIGAAVPMALGGVLSLRKQRKDSLRALSLLGAGSGLMGILFPTTLIGVCAMNTMLCNMLMRPILIGAGTLAIVASVIMFVMARDEEPVMVPAVA